MSYEDIAAQEKRDAEELAEDDRKREQWTKDNPGKPYASRLSPRLQEIRDIRIREQHRAERQAQAEQNNAAQERLHSKAKAQDEATKAQASKELEEAQIARVKAQKKQPKPKAKKKAKAKKAKHVTKSPNGTKSHRM